jgi:hypothetical protein
MKPVVTVVRPATNQKETPVITIGVDLQANPEDVVALADALTTHLPRPVLDGVTVELAERLEARMEADLERLPVRRPKAGQ